VLSEVAKLSGYVDSFSLQTSASTAASLKVRFGRPQFRYCK